MTVFNIRRENFGGLCRNGDLIAVCNMVQYMRQLTPGTKFYMEPGSVSTEPYCQEFLKFLTKQTDYFSEVPGDKSFNCKRVNIWDYRDIIGKDLVVIPNDRPMQKKIVICPVLDAQYNVWRNWPGQTIVDVMSKFSSPEFDDYEKLVCVKPGLIPENMFANYKVSTDFMENIEHIMTAEIFVGGDTGTSHFAWALERGPKELYYYASSRGLVHTLPFYLMEGKGAYRGYWVNMENTEWN